MNASATIFPDWQIGWPCPAPAAPLFINPQPASFPVYTWPQQTFTIGPDVAELERRIGAMEVEIAELKRNRRPKKRRR